jgi:hypothetical protein
MLCIKLFGKVGVVMHVHMFPSQWLIPAALEHL